MGRVCGRVYGSSLLVEFRFDFLNRVYGSVLRIVFYRSNRLVKFTGRVYGSSLWLISYGSNFVPVLRIVFSVLVL